MCFMTYPSQMKLTNNMLGPLEFTDAPSKYILGYDVEGLSRTVHLMEVHHMCYISEVHIQPWDADASLLLFRRGNENPTEPALGRLGFTLT